MVSKKRYYELKSQGLCTKCASPLEDSPSSVRCMECHRKFLASKKSKQPPNIQEHATAPKEESVNTIPTCNHCGKEKTGDSCNACIEEELKKKQITEYQERDDACRFCGEALDSIGMVCQKCMSTKQFTKYDALARYKHCSRCGLTDHMMLRIVSSDLSKPMKYTGPELYRVVCLQKELPEEYVASCHSCYRAATVFHIKEMREFFLSAKANKEEVETINVDIM